MLLSQGLGPPTIIVIPVLFGTIAAIATLLYFLIGWLDAGWLGAADNKSKRWCFSIVFACWSYYHFTYPPYVSSDALVDAAYRGARSSRLVELVGPPHGTSEISQTEMMWYYQTGILANHTIGIRINRQDGKVVDWYIH